MEENGLGQLIYLAKKHFPHEPLNEYTMAAAIWYERNFCQNMETAVCNGIARAFNGK